jgi:hypothetical protein
LKIDLSISYRIISEKAMDRGKTATSIPIADELTPENEVE